MSDDEKRGGGYIYGSRASAEMLEAVQHVHALGDAPPSRYYLSCVYYLMRKHDPELGRMRAVIVSRDDAQLEVYRNAQWEAHGRWEALPAAAGVDDFGNPTREVLSKDAPELADALRKSAAFDRLWHMVLGAESLTSTRR